MSTTTESLRTSPAGTWQLDPVHSSVGFEIAYLGGTFKGQFRDVAATLTVAGTETKLFGTAQVASVDVKDENLAAHLQAPDFFDAERHPELGFVADDIAVEGSTVDVDGEITIKGVTRPTRISGSIGGPITDGYGHERIGLKLSATVDRTDFGISWNMPLPSGEPALANDVAIDADLYFVKE